ncbi:hypothetical protein Dsin_018640 [Dipteronia sinensis]|uniref:DUF4218 domain-containing protein n=1 Tax=Dipteronia sinensis TaxID=43782 RepID=A0AAE0A6J4_9ROSI|nr:hypothetical protein Dsin_018640 [Dipteronia sinensis]
MRWHKDKLVNDGVLRHPADSKAWKDFDLKHMSFAMGGRNVRLGIASDGFNPFGNISNSYSMWPVFVVPYNLPPWKCMKDPFFMMSLLIPGPKAPGNDIDVYLQPLISELKELWDVGVSTYDAASGQNFCLRAAVLWTINDFPAYGNLSGWITKGKLACPSCNKDTSNKWLKHGNKTVYMRHRRFLPLNHKWRDSKTFDGTIEDGEKPESLSSENLLNQLSHAKLKLRHNLDVMHIEKNVCDSVLGTLMNIDEKTKDTYKTRLDLKEMGIRRELHPICVNGQTKLPPACYSLSSTEKRGLCQFLHSMKLLNGMASNISRCVNIRDCKITGLKSHDCHIILQQLLPVALRGYLQRDIRETIIELCVFFKELTSKTLKVDVLERLNTDIVLILCKLEKIFPPSFFDIMIHLLIHLAHEAMLGSPTQYRWMYPFERKMHNLKAYVRNKAHPEGSIAEGYTDHECLTFCSMYFYGIETRFNWPERNYDGDEANQMKNISVFKPNVRLLGAPIYDELNLFDWTKIRWEHRAELENDCVRNIEKKQEEEFHKWFTKHVSKSIDFYGVLKDIIEVPYLGQNRVVIFECDWWDLSGTRGILIDEHNLISVNVRKTWYKNDPFVLACQTQQVFYLNDIKLGNDWRVVDKSQPRGNYDVLEQEVENEERLYFDNPYQQEQSKDIINIVEDDNDDILLCMNDMHMIDVDVNVEDQNEFIDNFVVMIVMQTTPLSTMTNTRKTTFYLIMRMTQKKIIFLLIKRITHKCLTFMSPNIVTPTWWLTTPDFCTSFIYNDVCNRRLGSIHLFFFLSF